MSRFLKNEYNWVKEISSDVSLLATQMEKIRQEFPLSEFYFGKGKVPNKDCRREVWE